MDKRILFVALLLRAFLQRHIKHLGLGIVLGFFITLFIIQIYPVYNAILYRRSKVIGIVGQFDESNLPMFIKNKISFGLTSLNSDGEASPSVALSWKIDNDGLTHTFFLPDYIYWHDGSKFTSKDINLKLRGVTFEYPNETTLVVKLKEPYAPLPVFLSQPLFKPALTGLGIYKVVKIKYSEDNISELVLQPLKKDLTSLIYKFYQSRDDLVLAYKLGEINTIENISSISEFSEWKNTKITEINQYDRFVGIFLNMRNSLFKEKEIRQALNYATPLFPNNEKAYTPISPLSWAYSAKIRLYKYNPELAQKIFAKSPISSASTEIVISTYASLLEVAQAVADGWKTLGIKTKIKVENSIPVDYQVFILTLSIPPDPDQYQYWQSTQENTNIAHYSNLKIDKLLEDGRKTIDQEKRKKIYIDFQRYLVDDTPVIPLFYPKVYYLEKIN